MKSVTRKIWKSYQLSPDIISEIPFKATISADNKRNNDQDNKIILFRNLIKERMGEK